MAQKGRNDLESIVNSKIYDNSNKEIIARYVREVLQDFKDSFFNLKDDELRNLTYEGNKSLGDTLNLIGLVPPKWGATQYFDVGSSNGNLSGSNEGIVENTSYIQISQAEAVIVIDFKESIGNKKLSINVYTNETNMSDQNDICTPVIAKGMYGTKQIRVGLREVSSVVQNVRLEILAFTIQ